MPIKVIRRPMVASRRRVIVQEEVRNALKGLATVVRKRLMNDVKDWQSQPEFIIKVAVTANVHSLTARVSKSNKVGKIYGWIDEGVGEYGGKQPLPDIVPKNKKKYLGFTAPHSPVSMPNPSIPGFPSKESPHGVRVKSVRHPGIYPRNFTLTLMKWLKSKEPGAFRSVVEAAIKRAIRRSSQ